MAIKRKDFQKAAAFIHEFLLKLHEDSECAELRDSLNLALLHMQKYYRVLQTRNHEKNFVTTLSLTARGLSPMTPFVDAPDKFQYKWINLDSARLKASMAMDESMQITVLPHMIQAAKEGNTELIMELLNSDPSSIDDQDGLGRTALTYAVHFQQMQAMKCLLENEANPNVTAHDGSTAIHQACHDSNSPALNLLLQYGGDFTIPDTMGRAPIHWAVTTPNTECLQLTDDLMMEDVIIAKLAQNIGGEMADYKPPPLPFTFLPRPLLIHNHADVTVRDKDGLSPCMWACRLDHIQHFQLLSSSPNFHVDDADGIERDLIGRTWMHWSVRRMEPLECLQTLLTSETAAIKDEEGRTVLLTAAEMGSLAACKIILEIGGMKCIYDKDNHGRNALHLAAIGGHGDVVNFLLDNQADLSVADKFSATPWDYAKNRQLHYCQLIIMSHQRQRLVSNPTSPVPNGLGLMLNGSLSFSRGDFNSEFDYMSTQGSVDSMPITPPHPPKRPRTSRMPVRRSHSLGSQDRDRNRITASMNTSRTNYSREQSIERRQINSAGELVERRHANSIGESQSRPKERIEVSINTRRSAPEGFQHTEGREEVAMATDDNVYEPLDDELEGVSVGGMDVSDLEDEDEHQPPQTSRGPPPPRQPGLGGPQRSSGQQSGFQPAPPPRYQPRPPGGKTQYTQNQQAPFKRSTDFGEDHSMEMQPGRGGPLRSSNPPPGAMRGTQNYYNRTPSPNPPDAFTSSNKPRPAPRPPRMQPSPPKPQPRRTPSPVNRPGSGSRDQLTSPPTGDQSGKDSSRPDSAGRPPGMLEGKKILPPPMLMPLENAPKPPNLHKEEKAQRRRKKKKRERGVMEKDVEREQDVRSPPELPENLTPPRGYAAPLHPPPSATSRPPRAQSGIPSPKYSKGAPQKHESQRYVEENMEEEKDDSSKSEDKAPPPPMVNGMAVPIREAPMRSARPGGKRVQPMEMGLEEYEGGNTNRSMENGEAMQDGVINEDEEVGPLIPPPQGFRGPSARPGQGRPLSQSVPQDSRSNAVRSTSAKPPLPRGRNVSSSSSAMRYKNPSPPRRPPRQ